MQDSKDLYKEKVKELVSLLEMKGEVVAPTEPSTLAQCQKALAPYLLPEELIILYQHIKESKNLSFPWLNNIKPLS